MCLPDGGLLISGDEPSLQAEFALVGVQRVDPVIGGGIVRVSA